MTGREYNNQFNQEELDNEIWKNIPNYEGMYQISSLGRIRGLSHIVKSNWKNKVRKTKERILIPTFNKRLNRFWTRLNKQAKCKYIHTLVLEAFVGPRPMGKEACHNDGNSLNNRLTNLRWDTPENNVKDKIIHGSFRKGENHPFCKISQLTIDKIRELYNTGKYSSNVLGKMFKIDGRYIRHIVNNDIRKSSTYIKTCIKLKLIPEKIKEIRDLYKNKIFNQYELADLYNTDQTNISIIVRNKTWKEN